jgi:DNA-binding GntR family transcriptional regulator
MAQQLNMRGEGKGALAASVYENIFNLILSGEMETGMAISEVAIADRLGVSRTPVHEALRQLAADGLVEISQTRRTKVANFNADDVYEIFEMRKLLESAAAEAAAGRMDRRQIAPLQDMADELDATKDPVEWQKLWAEYDQAFHDAIANCCGNGRLAADICRYRMMHHAFNLALPTPEDLKQAAEEHREILAAINDRSGERARAAMFTHISRWQEYFFRHYPR